MERVAIERDEARRFFEREGEPYKVELVEPADGELSLYRQGEFTDLCRGPHLQDASPIKAVKLLSLAGAYWRGDETKPQLTRVYGTAFYDPKDLEEHLSGSRRPRGAITAASASSSTSFTSTSTRPGSPIWHPRGMVIWNALEDLRRARTSAAATRGEDAAPLRRRALEDLRALGQVPRQHVPDRAGGQDLRPQADELPRPHAPVRERDPEPPRPAAAATPSPRRSTATSRAGRCMGSSACATSRRTTPTSSARDEQIEDEVSAASTSLPIFTTSSSMEAASSSRRAREQARRPTPSGTSPRRLSPARSSGAARLPAERGRRRVLRPKIDLHMRTYSAARGRWDDPARRADAARFGLAYAGADNGEHTPYVIHRALLGSLERFIGILIEHFAATSRSGSLPSRCGCCPSRRRTGRGRIAR